MKILSEFIFQKAVEEIKKVKIEIEVNYDNLDDFYKLYFGEYNRLELAKLSEEIIYGLIRAVFRRYKLPEEFDKISGFKPKLSHIISARNQMVDEDELKLDLIKANKEIKKLKASAKNPAGKKTKKK